MTITDPRPSVWVGHIELATNSLDASEEFMIKIGMRPLFRNDDVAILELRGGTHIVLSSNDDFEPGLADFDLMVEDIEMTHKHLTSLELNPTPIQRGRIHDTFHITEPAGNTILFNSTHVSDDPV